MTELPVLDPDAQRILGSLLEKQATVPASYPLTANALRAACNQRNNREPVVDLDELSIERTARALKERGLLRIVWSDTGRRTLKYHQTLDERLGLAPDERALLTVLLLRGAQAPGELRTRTERLHGFADRGEVEACLRRMAQRPQPLVRELERRPGQQDRRWVHLLGPVPEPSTGGAEAAVDREAVLSGGAEERDARVRAAYDAVAEPYAEQLADELASDGIAVHSMHPGWVDTPGVRTFLPKFRTVTRPVIRTPEEGADTLVWLIAGDAATQQAGKFWHDRATRPTHYSNRTRESGLQRRRFRDFCRQATAPG